MVREFPRPSVLGRLKDAGVLRPLLILAGVVAVLLLAPIGFPGRPRWFYYLVDLQHLPLFGLAAWWGASLLVKRGFCSLYVWGSVLLGGSLVMEILQPLTGRYFEWLDLALNACGIGLSLHWWSIWHQKKGRLRRSVIGSALLLVFLLLPEGVYIWDGHQARTQFPVLADFEGRLDSGRWEERGVELHRVADPRNALSHVGEIVVTDNEVPYPGIHLREAAYDWTGLDDLLVTVGVPGPKPVKIAFRIDDRADGPAYADRFQYETTLEPGWHTLKFSRALLHTPAGNALAIEHIYCLSFFFTQAALGDRVYIDDVQIVLSDKERPNHDE